MQNTISDIKDIITSRLKNQVCIYFAIAWVYFNYELPMVVLFSKISIEKKIEFIKAFKIPMEHSFAYPTLLTILIIAIHKFLLPWIQGIIDFIQFNTVAKPLKNKLFERQANEIMARKKVKKAELMLDPELLRKEIELEQAQKELKAQEKIKTLKQPQIKEPIINRVDILTEDEHFEEHRINTLKELEYKAEYRFNNWNYTLNPEKPFFLKTYTYRKLKDDETMRLRVEGLGHTYLYPLNHNNKNIYRQMTAVNLNLLGNYTAFLEIVDTNLTIIDTVIFTITIDQH